jgi:hypothetical protein
MSVFWVVTSCRLIGTYLCFKKHTVSNFRADGDSIFLRSFGIFRANGDSIFSSKCSYLPTSLQGVRTVSNNIISLSSVRTSLQPRRWSKHVSPKRAYCRDNLTSAMKIRTLHFSDMDCKLEHRRSTLQSASPPVRT